VGVLTVRVKEYNLVTESRKLMSSSN